LSDQADKLRVHPSDFSHTVDGVRVHRFDYPIKPINAAFIPLMFPTRSMTVSLAAKGFCQFLDKTWKPDVFLALLA
jgi:hypothetical protein